MEIIFEVDKNDIETMERIKTSGCEILEIDTANGLNSKEIVAFVVKLTDKVKDLIPYVFNKKTLSMKLSDGTRTIELSANSIKDFEFLIDKYLELEKKLNSNLVLKP